MRLILPMVICLLTGGTAIAAAAPPPTTSHPASTTSTSRLGQQKTVPPQAISNRSVSDTQLKAAQHNERQVWHANNGWSKTGYTNIMAAEKRLADAQRAHDAQVDATRRQAEAAAANRRWAQSHPGPGAYNGVVKSYNQMRPVTPVGPMYHVTPAAVTSSTRKN